MWQFQIEIEHCYSALVKDELVVLIEASPTLCAGVTVIHYQYQLLHPLKCIDLGLLHRSTDNVTTLTVLSW